MADEPYREGVRLTRDGLFMLVAEEVFKDGIVTTAENELLGELTRLLKLPESLARSIARQARQRFLDGKLGTARPLSPEMLYERVLYFPGQEAGNATFALAPGGLPLPRRLHLICLAAATGVAGIGSALVWGLFSSAGQHARGSGRALQQYMIKPCPEREEDSDEIPTGVLLLMFVALAAFGLYVWSVM